MTTNTKTVEMVILKADKGKVLCDGYSKTSVGGTVTMGASSDASVWAERTEAEADAIIAENEKKEAEDAPADEV